MLNNFQETKQLFFKDSNYSEVSQKAIWNLYINFISEVEIESNKDLYYFELEEINKCNKKLKNVKEGTLNLINAFIKKYLEWSIKYYKVQKSFKLEIENKIDNSWYISKLDFYNLCEKLMNRVDSQFILPLLLIRYGITGKQMIYLRTIKWNNINFETNRVTMYDENNEMILSIPVDFQFLKWIDNLKDLEIKRHNNTNIDNFYIMQESEYKNKIINYNTVNSRIYYACKSVGTVRIPPYSLETSAKVDYLYKLSQYNVPITGKFIEEKLLKDWYKKESFSVGATYKLKNLYDDWIKDEGFNAECTITYIIKDDKDLKITNTKSDNVKNISNKKAVICLTTKKEFESTIKAGEFYKCDPSSITKCCKGKVKTCGNLNGGMRLTWMYLEDYNKNKE